MEKARRRLRVCLICVVTAAVVVGFVYYFHDVRDKGSGNEGTLVMMEKEEDGCRL